MGAIGTAATIFRNDLDRRERLSLTLRQLKEEQDRFNAQIEAQKAMQLAGFQHDEAMTGTNFENQKTLVGMQQEHALANIAANTTSQEEIMAQSAANQQDLADVAAFNSARQNLVGQHVGTFDTLFPSGYEKGWEGKMSSHTGPDGQPHAWEYRPDQQYTNMVRLRLEKMRSEMRQQITLANPDNAKWIMDSYNALAREAKMPEIAPDEMLKQLGFYDKAVIDSINARVQQASKALDIKAKSLGIDRMKALTDANYKGAMLKILQQRASTDAQALKMKNDPKLTAGLFYAYTNAERAGDSATMLYLDQLFANLGLNKQQPAGFLQSPGAVGGYGYGGYPSAYDPYGLGAPGATGIYGMPVGAQPYGVQPKSYPTQAPKSDYTPPDRGSVDLTVANALRKAPHLTDSQLASGLARLFGGKPQDYTGAVRRARGHK